MTPKEPHNHSHEPTVRAFCCEMPADGDHDVLALLRRRDPRGFDLAYARYGARLFGFLVRLSRSRALAEDLFQHTFLRLSEVGPSLRADSDLRAWLFSVARNAFHSQARALQVVARADAALFPAPCAVGIEPEASLALNELERALLGLNAGDRELLLLVGVEGLDYPEVAEILGIDAVAVRKRVSRARERLAQALDAQTGIMSKSAVRK